MSNDLQSNKRHDALFLSYITLDPKKKQPVEIRAINSY